MHAILDGLSLNTAKENINDNLQLCELFKTGCWSGVCAPIVAHTIQCLQMRNLKFEQQKHKIIVNLLLTVQGTTRRAASMTYNELAQVGGPRHQLVSLPGGLQGQGTLRFAAPRITACAGLFHCLFLLLDVLGTDWHQRWCRWTHSVCTLKHKP